MSARASFAVVAMFALAAPTAARADNRDEAQALFRVGEKAFDATQYAAAADAFEQAYAKLPLPAIAFSLAQAHRLQYFVDHQPAHLRRAVELYHLYIDQQKAGGRVADAVSNLSQIEPLARELGTAPAGSGATLDGRATSIMVVADVGGASVTIDHDTGPAPFVHDVEQGEHAITVTADGYQPLTRTVTAVPGTMLPIEVELVALPAKVVVPGPAGAELIVDGEPRGAAPVAGFELPAGKHVVAVSARGHEPDVRALELARGQTLRFDAKLEKTGQRKSVPWVLGGAGVLAIGAGAFAWAAHDAHETEIHDRDVLAQGSAPASVLAAYNQAVADHASRVHSAELLGGGAGVFALAGVALYAFDHPVVENPPPFTAAAPNRLTLTPVVAPSFAALVLGHRF